MWIFCAGILFVAFRAGWKALCTRRYVQSIQSSIPGEVSIDFGATSICLQFFGFSGLLLTPLLLRQRSEIPFVIVISYLSIPNTARCHVRNENAATDLLQAIEAVLRGGYFASKGLHIEQLAATESSTRLCFPLELTCLFVKTAWIVFPQPLTAGFLPLVTLAFLQE